MRYLVQMLVALAVVVYTALPMPVAAGSHHAAAPAAHEHHAGMSMSADVAMVQDRHAPDGDTSKGKTAETMHCAICLCMASRPPVLPHDRLIRNAPLPSTERSLIALAPAPQEPPPRS